MFGAKNPEKYEQRALQYEQKGNAKKANKNREKALRIRNKNATHGTTGNTNTTGNNASNVPIGTIGTTHQTGVPSKATVKSLSSYETKAIKWEQKGNYVKAQRQREKAWRYQNPQVISASNPNTIPAFYSNNQFLGYNGPFQSTTSSYTTTGLNQGMNTGYTNTGLNQGMNTGYTNTGINQGMNTGLNQGMNTGLNQGMNTGLNQGLVGNANPGYNQGLVGAQGLAGNTVNSALPATQRTIPPAGFAQGGAPIVGNTTNTNTTGFVQGGAPMVHTHTNATTVETHVRPTIVEQTTRAEKIVEIQPVIHREIDAPQVKVIEKHVYETVPSAGPHTVTRQAIVEETVKPRIIEEVQPVVHREVPVNYVERVEQHSTQHIVNPTITTKEIVNDATVRTAGVAAGVNPMAQQQTTTTTTTTNTTNNLTNLRK